MILWIKIAIAVAALAALSWGVHLYNEGIRSTQRMLDKAEYDQALLNAQADAKALTDAWMKKFKERDDATTKEIEALNARYAAVITTASSLRNELTNLSNGTTQLTPASCPEGVKALGTVLGECLERYSAMGRHAEGHLVDSEDCRAKWPTKGE